MLQPYLKQEGRHQHHGCRLAMPHQIPCESFFYQGMGQCFQPAPFRGMGKNYAPQSAAIQRITRSLHLLPIAIQHSLASRCAGRQQLPCIDIRIQHR